MAAPTSRQPANEAEESIRRFLSVLGHELRRPLSTIRSGIRLLQNSAADNTIVEVLDRESKCLEALLTELLDAAAIESGRLELNLTSTSLSDIVGLAVKEAEKSDSHREHPIFVDDLASEFEITADLSRAKQAVLNVIRFAAGRGNRGAPIEVKCGASEAEAKITIGGTGPGIPADQLPHLFDFFHASRPLQGREDPGLRLPTALKIVERHGGRLSFLQSQDGGRFQFEIVFPAESRST